LIAQVPDMVEKIVDAAKKKREKKE